MLTLYLVIPLVYLTVAFAHSSQESWTGAPGQTWAQKYGKQTDQGFSGPLSFSHLPYARCLEDASASFDIALLGMPFDTGTSYRPGARFGPYAIRSGSRRQRDTRGYTLTWKNNPYTSGYKIVDCGDVPVSPFDNILAIKWRSRIPVYFSFALDGKEHPRIITLGGDHTVVLPILRALNKVYGPVSVIHFDAHLDTFAAYPGQAFQESRVTHGTFFYLAYEERLMTNTSVHAGIRSKGTGIEDLEVDQTTGFQIISTDDIDDLGVPEIIQRIRDRVGDSPVYLSFDIDVIDPGLAPGTGTPEAGGWTTREAKRILRGLAGLNWVGADIVEVSPAYDNAEVTGIAAADLVHDCLSMFVASAPPKAGTPWVASKSKDEL